ncbi:hypothetical protein CBR_g49893 [Chara braunii]|uniref:Ferredoxin--nitrite reductase, chloroplastic n=1 Tax=Chara braunii TaxID=69332 RepID=A0A388JP82_CHABU|nr:hypothetical protein CBR_g49893 [Chara braunii]|eukprot:GBG59629.1 hypothetical protein CBR_g49893 [Chara braunii]
MAAAYTFANAATGTATVRMTSLERVAISTERYGNPSGCTCGLRLPPPRPPRSSSWSCCDATAVHDLVGRNSSNVTRTAVLAGPSSLEYISSMISSTTRRKRTSARIDRARKTATRASSRDQDRSLLPSLFRAWRAGQPQDLSKASNHTCLTSYCRQAPDRMQRQRQAYLRNQHILPSSSWGRRWACPGRDLNNTVGVSERAASSTCDASSRPWSVSANISAGEQKGQETSAKRDTDAGTTENGVGSRTDGQGMRNSTAQILDIDPERLDPRVARDPKGYYVLKEKYRKGINPIEKLKIAKDPMEIVVENRINEVADVNFEELDATKEGKDDIDTRFKWLGLFHRRKHQYGRFMMRLKLPNGVINSRQTRFLANCIKKYGPNGCADVTTRQNCQIRGVVNEDVPAILKGLSQVGLTSLQSGMDSVRNPVGNPLAGIDPSEIIDTRPYNQALSNYITGNGTGNLEITNLPRKWNVAVVGSHDLYEHPHINDLAYIPAMKDGKMGFNLLVGGFFSPKRCEEAIPLDAWVHEQDVVPLCHAVLTTFRDLGARSNRQKCRMMWLIDDLGVECFRQEVEKRMLPSKVLERAAPEDLINQSWKRRDYFGVHPQKQQGLSYVGIHIPVGRLQACDMYELARIADEFGNGELRLTVEQNMIIPNVCNERVERLLAEPLLKKFSPVPSRFMSGLVACTGNQFCGLALIETKQAALMLAQSLEETIEVPHAVRMHWTGCPNSCGQVQVADIGFMGCGGVKDENGKPCDAVDIFIGGGVGTGSHLGKLVRSAVRVKELLPTVQDLLIEHFGATRKQQ